VEGAGKNLKKEGVQEERRDLIHQCIMEKKVEGRRSKDMPLFFSQQ
jgi:hypothetical protein